LDYGTRRVGIAFCDELGVAVRPAPAISNRSLRDLLAQIRRLVEQNEIQGLVVGLPLNMDGTAGESADRARKFMQTLQSQLNLPASAIDERLTTVEAAQLWKNMSARQRKKYRSVDSLAAALILQRFLEEQ
jgi:putative Holliday junction resolvase